MKTPILAFCKKYKEMLAADADIATTSIDPIYNDFRSRISFFIVSSEFCPATWPSTSYMTNPFTMKLRLDEEDLSILFTKYSKKLMEEMEQEIETLKQKYASKQE